MLEPTSLVVAENKTDYNRMTQLRNTLTREDNAVKACGKLTGWKVKTACRNEHGQAYELANNELSIMIEANNDTREVTRSKLTQLKALQEIGKNARTEQNDIVLMPFAALLTDNKQTGKLIQSVVGVIFSFLIVMLNASLYWLGGGLIGNFFKSDALPSSDFAFTKPIVIKRKIDDMGEALGTMAAAMYQRKTNTESVPVYQRGHSESLIDKKGTDGKEEYATTKMGFVTDDTQIRTPENTKTNRESVAFAYDALKTAVQDGSFYKVKKKCTGRAVMAYLRSINIQCSQNTAYDLVDKLKSERIIDEEGKS